MSEIHKNRVMCPIRLPKNQYEIIKLKAINDHLTYQKVVEVLLTAYERGDKYICAFVKKFSEEINEVKKSKNVEFDNLEVNEIRRMLETQYSPLRNIETAKKELEEK